MAEKNYCTPKGECTVPHGTPESDCQYCTPSMSNGLCSYRAWFLDKCLSPWALTAARAAAAPPIETEAN